MRNILDKWKSWKANKVQKDRLGTSLLFVLSFAFVLLIICFERGPVRWSLVFPEGEPAPRSFFAPFSVSILNEKTTNIQREAASRAVPDVYDIDTKLNDSLFSSLDETFSFFKQNKTSPSESLSWDRLKVNVSESNIRIFLGEDLEYLHQWTKNHIRRFLEQGVMDFARKMELLNEGKKTIIARGFPKSEKERVFSLKQVITPSEILSETEKIVGEQFSKNRKLRSALTAFTSQFLKPNLIFNEVETQLRQRRASSEVPEVFEDVKKNQMIIQKGTIVTSDISRKLDAIETRMVFKKVQKRVLGTGLIVCLSFLVLGCFLFYFEKETFRDWKKMVLIHALLIFVLLIERLALNIPYPFVFYLLPASVFPLALSLLLNRRIGFLSAAVISILNVLLTNFSMEVFLYSFLGGMVATYTAIGLRKRSQFLKVGSAMGLTHFFAIFGYNILQEVPLEEAMHLGVLGIVNGFLIAIPMLFIVLPILEHIFGLVTDITLLELSDLNHPLLRRLVMEAPGTYHHSLVVSSLAEAACEAIGANSLLARVGGYFHDIGKLEKPEYFTENQTDKQDDRHGKLSPSMSYLVIASHVKDGIELAKKYNLKEVIADFIPQHQGTCPVYYFYKKASNSSSPEDIKINIDDYRYPGPKPQLRETAVVLLADSVEAASRSLTNVTPLSIEDLVKDVINNKFIDGQLDECDLTLQDVRRIQESFVHNLIGIFHTRIQYPKSDAEPLWQKIVSRKTE